MPNFIQFPHTFKLIFDLFQRFFVALMVKNSSEKVFEGIFMFRCVELVNVLHPVTARYNEKVLPILGSYEFVAKIRNHPNIVTSLRFKKL